MTLRRASAPRRRSARSAADGTRNRGATATAHVPGPRGTPLLGSLGDLRRDTLGTYLRAWREYGDVVRFTAGPPGARREFHCVFSASGARQVLATGAADFRKDSTFYREIRASFGNGLLTSQDDEYLRQRRLIQPLFTPRRVEGYAGAVTDEAAAAVAAWRRAGGGTVDLAADMTRFTLRTVTRVLFGTDADAAVDVVRRSFPVLSGQVLRRGIAPFTLPRGWPAPGNRKAAAARRDLHALCDRIVAERRAAAADGGDLLTLLTRADGGGLSAREVRDQVLVFLLAGHETTATSLTFALYLLGRHPGIQRRARREVREVLGDRTPDAADLGRLPYLTMVVKEAMRLYPAAPAVGRRAARAVSVDGRPVPAGADVLVVPWVTHRHTAYWDEPERFDPERFTPEREAARPRYAWLPFGGGPRACIGRHFSMLESVLALAVFLRAYAWESPDRAIPLGAGITLTARKRVRARLVPV